ncbi:MAG: hypothetical protein ACSW8F_01250 [bacterium]
MKKAAILLLLALSLSSCANYGDLAEAEVVRCVAVTGAEEGVRVTAAGEEKSFSAAGVSLAEAAQALTRLPLCGEASLSHAAQFVLGEDIPLRGVADFIARSRELRLKTEVYYAYGCDAAQVFDEADHISHRLRTLAHESRYLPEGRSFTAGEAIDSLAGTGYCLLSAVEAREGAFFPAGLAVCDAAGPVERWEGAAAEGAALILNRVEERTLSTDGGTFRLTSLKCTLRGGALRLTGTAELMEAEGDGPSLPAAERALAEAMREALTRQRALGADVLKLKSLALQSTPPEVKTISVHLTLKKTGDVA